MIFKKVIPAGDTRILTSKLDADQHKKKRLWDHKDTSYLKMDTLMQMFSGFKYLIINNLTLYRSPGLRKLKKIAIF